MDFVAAVRKMLVRRSMAPRGSRVLCAVSGGPDSMTMLDALCSLRNALAFELGAAYVDHGLRRRAEAERAFVECEARRLSVPFHFVSVDAKGTAKREKTSIEAAARTLRYEALAAIASRHGYDRIATAHTANDQAETVLMHVIAGTGLDGLAGIRPVLSEIPQSEIPNPKSVTIVRPLLSVTRKDVEAFLRKKKIPSLTDETNLDPRFERNRVRRRLLPLIEKEFNPSVIRALSRLAENALEDSEAIESLVGKAFDEAVSAGRRVLRIDRKKLNSLPGAIRARVLDRALGRTAPRARFDRAHIESLSELAARGTGTSHLDLPGSVRATISYDTVALGKGLPRTSGSERCSDGAAGRPPACPLSASRAGSAGRSKVQSDCSWRDAAPGHTGERPAGPPSPVVVNGSGSYAVPWANVTFHFGTKTRRGTLTARFDRASADYPFVIRPFRPGYRIAPPFSRHTRKLKKIFIEKKIPREDRARLPILCCGNRVVWVPGVTDAPVARSKAALLVTVTQKGAKSV
jgi:tRNA(Ile)-lysidine synthase